MTPEEMKLMLRRAYDEGFSQGRLEVVDEIVAPDYRSHDAMAGEIHGVEGAKRLIMMLRTALPDMVITVEDMLVDGDQVAARWTGTGTHLGPLGPIPPTGKSAIVTGIVIARFEDGKIVEEWQNWDALGMLRQFGVLPAGPGA
jgi:steroid delta-isomerase-like uncharacterized protein